MLETQTGGSPQSTVGGPVSAAVSDAALIEAAIGGSGRAAGELVDRYWPNAYRAAYLITGDAHGAEDVAQEALLKAISSLKRFRRGRPFGPWVHRIAVNGAIDRTRAEAIRPRPTDKDEGTASEPLFEGSPLDPRLTGALAALPPVDRGAVVLRYVLDYTAPEIGEMLSLQPGAVRTRLHRAMTRIREEMEASDG